MGTVFSGWNQCKEKDRASDMSCRKSISTLAFTSSLNKFPLLLGYFMCIILFLSLIDTASSASDKFDRRLHPKIRRQLFSPNMAAKYVNPSRPSYGFNEDKRDPLFEN